MGSSNEELKSIRRTAHDWQVRLGDFDISDEERTAFEAWKNADPRHEDAYERAAAISTAIGQLSRKDLDPDLAPLASRNRFVALSSAAAGILRAKQLQLTAAVVASATIVALSLPSILKILDARVEVVADIPTTFASAIGKSREITLDDGTSMTLGAASEISVSISPNARDLKLLRGAAFFDVASDPSRPFTVTADRLTAKALGTQFDVRRSGGVTRVAVAEGRVEVGFPVLSNGAPIGVVSRRLISAGAQIAATDSDGLQSTVSIDAARVGEWRSDRLIYETATLAELVADANRYTEATVDFAPGSEFVAAYKISGAFNGRDIDGMLTTLEAIHPVEIDRSQPDIIRIKAKDG
ncbi:MAG: FecR domain-containing protein [Pseudomonadota bacterium]